MLDFGHWLLGPWHQDLGTSHSKRGIRNSQFVTRPSKLGIRHYVGGSVASSFHGASRSTMDVDIVADMTDSHVSEFLKCFDKDFYVSGAAIRDAIP